MVRSLGHVFGHDENMESTGSEDTLEGEGRSPLTGHHDMSWATGCGGPTPLSSVFMERLMCMWETVYQRQIMRL